MTVHVIWRVLFILLAGFALGMFVAFKYMVPPSTEIRIGRIKLRGRGNSITDVLDVTPEDPKTSRKEQRQKRREERKEARQ